MAEQQITFKPVLLRASGTPFENLPTKENPPPQFVPGGSSNTGGSSSAAFTGTLLHTLTNPNASSTSDRFAYSVSISDTYAVVGASREDINGTDSGVAYIFDITAGNLLHTLTNPNAYGTTASDRFGYSVAISGDRAIVGAYLEDAAGGTDSGAAYIFDCVTGNLLHTLINPNSYTGVQRDYFGSSVAISNNYAIVGAWGEDRASLDSAGAAYIFDVTTGNLLHTLTNPNTLGTQFGLSVAISDSHAIVGTPSGNHGLAYIFDINTGSLVHMLINPNEYDTKVGDNFGQSVAISGNTAIVGAPNEDSVTALSSGAAYIFDVSTGNLLHTLTNPFTNGTSDGYEFGYSVSISGNTAIIGARNFSGIAYIYDVVTGNLSYTIPNPNTVSSSGQPDYFGWSVAISSDRAIVGAWGEDSASGADSGVAYIYN